MGLRPTLRKIGFSLLRLHPIRSQNILLTDRRLPRASNCNAKRTQPLTTSTSTASVADVVCVIVPLVSANVSRPSLVKGVAELLAPTTWGIHWPLLKYQQCHCDAGYEGDDCSLRRCP